MLFVYIFPGHFMYSYFWVCHILFSLLTGEGSSVARSPHSWATLPKLIL